ADPNAGCGGFGSPCATPLAVMDCPSDLGPASAPVWDATGLISNVLGEDGKSHSNPVGGWTSYRGIFLPSYRGVIVTSTAPTVRTPAIRDGTSNTILFGEFYNYCPVKWTPKNKGPYAPSSTWGGANGSGSAPIAFGSNPLNRNSLPGITSCDTVSYGSGHSGGGVNFAFCGCSVRFLSHAINNAPPMKG